MIIEVLPDGIGSTPVRLNATQVLVRSSDGTPLMVAAEYGPPGTHLIGSLGHNKAEFEKVLRELRIATTKLVLQSIKVPQPMGGAQLLSNPG